jgi:hypothetical protein
MTASATESLPAVSDHRVRAPCSAALVLSGVCAAITSIALLISGTTAIELLLFACFQLAFAVVPGLLSYLLLVGRPRLVRDTLALAIPLGLAIQIGCFVLTAAIGERWLFSIYPVVFIVATAPLLYLRRETLGPIRSEGLLRPVTPKSMLTGVLITVATLFVIYLAVFATNPLPREIHSASYYPDFIFDISLAAEILHHWPFVNPSVSGVALHYHIFVNIAIAATAQITQLDLSTIVMRLEPTFLVGLIAVELYVLGRKVGGSLAAGITALVIGLFAGEVNFSWIDLANGGIPTLGLLFSPSYQLGAVFFLAICIVLVEHMELETHSSRVRHVLLLGILSFGAVGAKVSVMPILAAGLTLFILGQAPLRDANLKAIRLESIWSLAVVASVGVAGYVLIYRGGGDGLTLKPLNFLTYTGFASVYRQANHSLVYVPLSVLAGAIVLCVLLLSLAGILFVRARWLPLRSAPSPERLLLCMFAASLPPFVLIAVPADSQVYFIAYGFLAASVVSAAGVTEAMRALRLRAADLIRPGLVCAAGVLAVIVGLWTGRSTVALVPAYAFLTCIVILTVWLLRRRVSAATVNARRALLTLGAVVLICLTVASELFEQTAPTIDRWLRGEHAFEPSGAGYHHGITTDLLQGLEWLRHHTLPSAVIAVNNHDLSIDGGSRYVYYSAFSERRVFLESWEYTSQGARYESLGRTETPFPRLLAINDAAVLRASPAAISLLHDRYGVRYIAIDRHHGPQPPNLDRVAALVYSNPDIAVFKVVGRRAE